MLTGHLRPLRHLVDETKQQVGMQMGPILVQHLVEVVFGILEVSSLDEESTHEDTHVSVIFTSLAVDLPVDALLCLDL